MTICGKILRGAVNSSTKTPTVLGKKEKKKLVILDNINWCATTTKFGIGRNLININLELYVMTKVVMTNYMLWLKYKAILLNTSIARTLYRPTILACKHAIQDALPCSNAAEKFMQWVRLCANQIIQLCAACRSFLKLATSQTNRCSIILSTVTSSTDTS